MSWVESEFEMLDIGDHRLNQRTIQIVEGLGLSPGRTIPQPFNLGASLRLVIDYLIMNWFQRKSY